MSVEPNYEMLFRSSVTGLQTAYNEYKQAIKNYYDSVTVGDDGNFAYIEETKKYRDEANRVVDEMDRLIKDIGKYRELKEGLTKDGSI